MNYAFGYQDRRSPTENIEVVNAVVAPGTVPVNSVSPFDENDDRHPRASSAERVLPRTAETSVGIRDDREDIQGDPVVWVCDGEQTAVFFADAASGEAAEVVGGAVYIFDQEDREEKLKAAVSSFGSTDLLDLRQAKLDAVARKYHQ